jgi:hypothetical protein
VMPKVAHSPDASEWRIEMLTPPGSELTRTPDTVAQANSAMNSPMVPKDLASDDLSSQPPAVRRKSPLSNFFPPIEGSDSDSPISVDSNSSFPVDAATQGAYLDMLKKTQDSTRPPQKPPSRPLSTSADGGGPPPAPPDAKVATASPRRRPPAAPGSGAPPSADAGAPGREGGAATRKDSGEPQAYRGLVVTPPRDLQLTPASKNTPSEVNSVESGDSWLKAVNMPDSPWIDVPSPEHEMAVAGPAEAIRKPAERESDSIKPFSLTAGIASLPARAVTANDLYRSQERVPDSDDETIDNMTPQKPPPSGRIAAPARASNTGLGGLRSPLTTSSYSARTPKSVKPALIPSSEEAVPSIPEEPVITAAERPVAIVQLRQAMLGGDAALIRRLVFTADNTRRSIDPPFTENDASKLLLECCIDPKRMKDPKETILVLTKEFGADVNFAGADGKVALFSLLLYPELASFIIELGANVLVKDRSELNPLSVCLDLFSQGIIDSDWIIDAFESSSQYSTLDDDSKLEYVTTLAKNGRHVALSRIISSGRITLSPAQASAIMKSCNFETMTDSMETYEILERCGGQLF